LDVEHAPRPFALTPTRLVYAVGSVDMSSIPSVAPVPTEWHGKHCELIMVEYT
jgi:hypothetical protein